MLRISRYLERRLGVLLVLLIVVKQLLVDKNPTAHRNPSLALASFLVVYIQEGILQHKISSLPRFLAIPFHSTFLPPPFLRFWYIDLLPLHGLRSPRPHHQVPTFFHLFLRRIFCLPLRSLCSLYFIRIRLLPLLHFFAFLMLMSFFAFTSRFLVMGFGWRILCRGRWSHGRWCGDYCGGGNDGASLWFGRGRNFLRGVILNPRCSLDKLDGRMSI